ncbi:MAG: hypothetical protein ACYDBB_09245 [Armatimonadota bacterium]
MNKKQKEIFILVASLVVLIVVGYFTLRGSPTPTRNAAGSQAGNSAQAAATQPVTAPVVTRKPKSVGLSWVDTTRVPRLVAEVSGGRNPFQDLLGGGTVKPPVTVDETNTGKDHNLVQTNDPILPPPPPPTVRTTRVLEWTTVDAVRKALSDELVLVNVTASKKQPNEVTLSGDQEEMDKALAIVQKLNAVPPAPPFRLIGVIITRTERYCTISLDEKYYTLSENETIPTVGWTVTSIKSTGATLAKGKQKTLLSLSGGNPK